MQQVAWTVLGPIDPSKLGITLPHEHLFIDEVPVYFKRPKDAIQRRLAHQPLDLSILGFVRFNPNSNKDNMRLDNEEMMIDEVLRFKSVGGNTIVDVTNSGMGRDPIALKKVSLCTGVNVIGGSGYYVSASHPPEMESKTVDTIKNEIIKEIRHGIGDSGIRAGIIGEIGTTFPWEKNEKKSLQGAARAQVETGAPLEIHPGRSRRHPAMILKILEKEEVDLTRVSICHIDRTLEDLDDIKEILDKGCFIEFDLFGQAWYPPEIPLEIPFPSDHIRVYRIKDIIKSGYIDQILISHDIDTKYLTYRYGGHGYAHILKNIVPLMLNIGISQEDIHKMLVDNPRRFLTFSRN